MNILDKDYKKFFIPEGEVGFSPERNKKVMEDSIKKADLMRIRKMKEYDEQVRERANAVTTYLFSRQAEGNRPIEKYFGKRNLAHLQGINLVNRISLLDAQSNNLYNSRGVKI